MPQRKWQSNPISDAEQKLAGKLFDETHLKSEFKETQSPIPFSILCGKKEFKKEDNYYGEDIGWPEPACNDFFPTPTDQGMCMTANLNIQDIVHNYEDYDPLMESGLQKSKQKIQGGTVWSQKTYVIGIAGTPLIAVIKVHEAKNYMFPVSFSVTPIFL